MLVAIVERVHRWGDVMLGLEEACPGGTGRLTLLY
jgi:hypothetical protein